MKKYLVSNEKKISARSDVIWPFKKNICQNRIKKISQNVAKMLKKICLNLPNSTCNRSSSSVVLYSTCNRSSSSVVLYSTCNRSSSSVVLYSTCNRSSSSVFQVNSPFLTSDRAIWEEYNIFPLFPFWRQIGQFEKKKIFEKNV